MRGELGADHRRAPRRWTTSPRAACPRCRAAGPPLADWVARSMPRTLATMPVRLEGPHDERRAQDDGRVGLDARVLVQRPAHRGHLVLVQTLGPGEDVQVRVEELDLLLDARGEPGGDGQGDDERHHAHGHAEGGDDGDERDEGLPPARHEVAAPDEEDHAHEPGASPRGLRSGKRTTSRMEAVPVRSMASRSMPRPSPAVGGRPYSRAWQ